MNKKNLIKKFLSVMVTLSVTASFLQSVCFSESCDVSVTIPYADTDNDGINDYILEFGRLSSYYVYDYFSPNEKTSDSSSETYNFSVDGNSPCFCRVSNPYDENCITYGSYVNPENSPAISISRDLLYPVQYENMTKHTVINDFSLNEYDTGDIYMNINPKGHISVNPGDSYTLFPLRNWLAVESIMNAKVTEPDFHYEIINLAGDDFLSITENLTDTPMKHSAEITSHGEGTAIVTVTYDAMIALGMSNRSDVFYSAIRPENTGVFVISSGIPTGTNTGMTVNTGMNEPEKKLSGDYIDYEHDILYYTGPAGAEYSFTPEQGTSVSVLRPE
ncbi:MAG: hypothetical protein J1F64_07450, partial [Oscillospiraceae bacterium]|nr:hypothetical protein [Oscillospiraceae bacterium]